MPLLNINSEFESQNHSFTRTERRPDGSHSGKTAGVAESVLLDNKIQKSMPSIYPFKKTGPAIFHINEIVRINKQSHAFLQQVQSF